MTCRYCHRHHDTGVLCQGVSRRAFFFFGAAAAVAPFESATDRHVAKMLEELEFVEDYFGKNAEPGPLNQLAQRLIKKAGVGQVQIDGVDLSTHIREINLDEMHRRLEAGERDLFGRPITGLKDLKPFEVTLSGFWEGATHGKG